MFNRDLQPEIRNARVFSSAMASSWLPAIARWLLLCGVVREVCCQALGYSVDSWSQESQELWNRLLGCWRGRKYHGGASNHDAQLFDVPFDGGNFFCCILEPVFSDVAVTFETQLGGGVARISEKNDHPLVSVGPYLLDLSKIDVYKQRKEVGSLNDSLVSLPLSLSATPGSSSEGVVYFEAQTSPDVLGYTAPVCIHLSLEDDVLSMTYDYAVVEVEGDSPTNVAITVCPASFSSGSRVPGRFPPTDGLSTCIGNDCWAVPDIGAASKTARTRMVMSRCDIAGATGSAEGGSSVENDRAQAGADMPLVIGVSSGAAGVLLICMVSAICISRHRSRLLKVKSDSKAGNIPEDIYSSRTTAMPSGGDVEESGGSFSASVHQSSSIFQGGNLVDLVALGIEEGWVITPEKIAFQAARGITGGFGDVRRGMLLGSVPVAIKICKDLAGASLVSQLQAGAMRNEIRLLRRIRHPNIVLFYGFTVMAGGGLAMVLEWADGGDLGVFMKKRVDNGLHFEGWRHDGRPVASLAQVAEVKLLHDIARGLDFLHQSEPTILHRDIKPGNVLVIAARPEKAKLTDFGLSRLVRDGDEVTERVGTRRYMAPEVFGGKIYSKPADVFGLGCLVMFVLTAQHPPASDLFEWAKAACADIVSSKAAPHLLVELALESLDDDPDRRPTASDVFWRLDAALKPLGARANKEEAESA
eukprot:CAMPEP_0176071970 /NCGR_PEP_ID=MMETSP0120_2-20121206/35950_1 /TAXON_ID=160619 /ORGANISM="Kryptoperidinium foliaceum, Strain CCMP 1326" /LENGTH=699 /DNA_ID=CAMNT_0017405633 /DNA_START=1 /DNA_END=2100 /DNA_ORIENTATION=+